MKEHYELLDDVLVFLKKMLQCPRCRTEVFVESYKYLDKTLDVGSVFKSVKGELNRLFIEYVRGMDFSNMGLGELLEAMALANGIDVELPDYNGVSNDLSSLSGLFSDSVAWVTGSVVELLGRARNVAVVLDNAGEAVVDVVVSLELLRRGYNVVLIARGEDYEVDITYSEVAEILSVFEQDKDLSINIVSTSSRYPVFSPKASTESRKVLEAADIVLVKGMGNAEAYLEYPIIPASKVVFLLRAKCRPFAEILGVGTRVSVIVSGIDFVERVIRYKEKLASRIKSMDKSLFLNSVGSSFKSSN